MDRGFDGRRLELQQLAEILERRRGVFVKVTGRRRRGKTSLIQQALVAARSKGAERGVLHVQIPDSGPAGAGVLSAARGDLLRKVFFASSSPLGTEADNWFLKEQRGRYDVVLKHLARNEGCNHGPLVEHVREMSRDTEEQVAGYLKLLSERHRLIGKRPPVCAKPKTPRGRCHVTDNCLAAWLAALANPVSAISFSPTAELVAAAEQRIRAVEGHAFEKLVGRLYEERSRKRIGASPLSRRIGGHRDSSDTQLDLVAIDKPAKRSRCGTCKRSEAARGPEQLREAPCEVPRGSSGVRELDHRKSRYLCVAGHRWRAPARVGRLDPAGPRRPSLWTVKNRGH